MADTDNPIAAIVAEDMLVHMLHALDAVCAAHGLSGVPAAQAKFVACVHALGTVAQRAGLSKAYVLECIAEMVPRAMDASEGDEHIDIHRGGVPS